MSKNKNKDKKKKKVNILSRIIGIIFNILLIIFLGLIIYMNVLPTKYFSLVFSPILCYKYIRILYSSLQISKFTQTFFYKHTSLFFNHTILY